jgi:NAD(P)-dependent dehydrogenase (short-subunit alcohol dehydrogenase family)
MDPAFIIVRFLPSQFKNEAEYVDYVHDTCLFECATNELAGLHLLDRIGEPNDVAEATYYLATSNFVTGETFNVDGGHVAGHRFA